MNKVKTASGPVKWFLKLTGYEGITLPPFGIYILASHLNDQKLIKHEMCHWEQAHRIGILKWYTLYLYYNLRYGYWNNPFEVEARQKSEL